MPRVQLLLAYYDRPSLAQNALLSIRDSGYSDWCLYFLDDGSPRPGRPVAERILRDHLEKVTFEYVPDTADDKRLRGGSRFGAYLNHAILKSDAEIVVMVCDDDALIPGGLSKLVAYYDENPSVMYAYSWIATYDPSKERPDPSFLDRPCHLNREGPIQPANQVDSSQVTWRRRCFDNPGVRYPEVRTVALDSELFSRLYGAFGACHPTHIHLQYKAFFDNALGARPPERMYETGDPDPASQ